MKTDKNLKNIAESVSFYICSFFIYCVIGWIYEVIMMYCYGFGFINRGFLHGCYIPIYGFSSLLFILSLQRISKKKILVKNINLMPVIIFILVFIASSLIEYTAAYILETVFNLRLWNYSDYKYNLHGRIALRTSIYFGIGGTSVIYLIQPLLERIRIKINSRTMILTASAILIIMTSDFIITVL